MKPVKATYSVLARRVDTFDELKRHLSFWPFEKFIIKRLVKPFNDLMSWYTDCRVDTHHMIAEELLEGVQLNLDGYVYEGRVTTLGIIDANMYPGTQAFASFEYPSRVPPEVRERLAELAERIVTGIGYRHGFFNAEFIWNPASGRIHLIEVNPRMASQLAYLYECVDGINLYRLNLELALGNAPSVVREAPRFGHAASFALRKFDGKPLAAEPTREALSQVSSRFPEARLMLYLKHGAALAREMKWLGSYRYAVVNMGAASPAALYQQYADMRAALFTE